MKRKEFKERRETKEKEYDNFWESLKFFPGSIFEYEKHVGYSVRIVDTGQQDMGVLCHTSIEFDQVENENIETLIKEKTEALVNGIFMVSVGMVRRYGLPVTRSF